MIIGPPPDDGMPEDPFNDDESNGHNEDAMRADMDAQAQKLQERLQGSELEAKLQSLGLYLEQTSVIPIPQPDGSVSIGVAMLATVNKVAFSKRVLDPEQAAVDKQFRMIDHSSKTDDFLDARKQMQKNIAEGRDPLDDGPGA